MAKLLVKSFLKSVLLLMLGAWGSERLTLVVSLILVFPFCPFLVLLSISVTWLLSKPYSDVTKRPFLLARNNGWVFILDVPPMWCCFPGSPGASVGS